MKPEDIDLSVCVRCGQAAQFTDADPGANPVSYCTQHLPEHFRGRALEGRMPLQTDETADELLERAQELDVPGRSTMTKAQLQSAVAAAKLTDVLDKERKDKDKEKDEPEVEPEVEPEKDKDDPKPPKPVKAARRKRSS